MVPHGPRVGQPEQIPDARQVSKGGREGGREESLSREREMRQGEMCMRVCAFVSERERESE